MTVEKGFLGLYCDGESREGECANDGYQEPEFLDCGFTDLDQLRKFAAERGWTHVKPPGRPWGDGEDFCPRCKPQPENKPENTIEVRG